ncbi:Signal peptidase I W [archaeon HR01]|nr:Signal peptidase I W [archaeon HR01]
MKAKKIAYGVVFSLIAVMLVLSILHTSLGLTYPLLVVKSGSMRPVIEVGDIILVTPVAVDDIRASPTNGDVIVFYRPGEKGAGNAIIVHRAVGKVAGGFITKGDANSAPDYWSPVPPDHILGRWTGIKIPYWTGLGYLSLFLRGEYLSPLGPLLVVVLIVVNISLIARDIARNSRKNSGRGDGDGESAEPA